MPLSFFFLSFFFLLNFFSFSLEEFAPYLWNKKHVLGADIFPAEPALQIAWTVQLCLLVTVLGLGVRLIWKDFLHSKKQQDLIIVRGALQHAARLFKEPLSPGTFKNYAHETSVKNTERKSTLKGRVIARSAGSFPSLNSRTVIWLNSNNKKNLGKQGENGQQILTL